MLFDTERGGVKSFVSNWTPIWLIQCFCGCNLFVIMGRNVTMSFIVTAKYTADYRALSFPAVVKLTVH